MTYGRVRQVRHDLVLHGAAVSHLAELVRGDFHVANFHVASEGPLIRPVLPKASLRLGGAPSPQGEKGPQSSILFVSHTRERR
jgi:hypothetical protein